MPNLKDLLPDYTSLRTPNAFGLADYVPADYGAVNVGGRAMRARYDTTTDNYFLWNPADERAGSDVFKADGGYSGHAAYNDIGSWGENLAEFGATAGALAFGLPMLSEGGAAVSGMDLAADTPGFAGSYAGGGGAAGGMVAGGSGGGAAGGAAAGAAGGSGGGAAGGAGMQWGTGAGGAMTAADYARYAQLAGGAAGMLAAKGGGGGGGGGSGQQYVPTGLAGADATWQGAMRGSYDLASGARGMATGGFDRSFRQANDVNYSPYVQRAGQAGDAYGAVGDAAMGQMGQYGQRASAANGQQDLMYGAGRKVLDTAFDPQNALYDRTAQHVQDQIRAGQAARGLGNSEAGMMEEAGAMGNFNIDWQNAQLGRQATGIQAAGGATSAGDGAGRLAGADWAAGLQAGAAGAGYYGQAGQVPMSAAEYAAGAPGRASAGLVGGYGSMQGMYGNAQSGIIPYMNAGNGAIQGNYGNNYQANRDMVSGMTQLAGAAGPTVAGWFGSGSGGGSGGSAGTPWSTNWGAAMNGSYGDSAYG